jgi:putative tryptophan/tyrosine transport system substrate-binding protein
MLFALCSSASAQQPAKIPRLGYLAAVPLSSISPRIEAFRQGLRDHGYIEGKNIVIDWRSSDGKVDRLSGIASGAA